MLMNIVLPILLIKLPHLVSKKRFRKKEKLVPIIIQMMSRRIVCTAQVVQRVSTMMRI
jgi:hypothetical protein